MWLDIRYALRMMTKSVGLTAVLAITLAVGIGASTTIFSVVSSVVLKPLPYEQPAKLVRVYTRFHGLGLDNFYVITRYNRSSFYASSVADLAAALRTRYPGGR